MRDSTVFQEVANILGLTINKIESTMGVSNGTIRKAIERKSALKSDMVEKFVSAYPQISRNWVLTGEGEFFNNPKINANSLFLIPSNLIL